MYEYSHQPLTILSYAIVAMMGINAWARVSTSKEHTTLKEHIIHTEERVHTQDIYRGRDMTREKDTYTYHTHGGERGM